MKKENAFGMDPCLVFGLGSMLASEILWHMLHHRTMPFRIDYGFRVPGFWDGVGWHEKQMAPQLVDRAGAYCQSVHNM